MLHTVSSRKVLVAIMLVVSALVLNTMTTQRASAHGVDQNPQTHTMVINGTPYHLAAGQEVRISTTFANGTKGFVGYKFTASSATPRFRANAVRPDDTYCEDPGENVTYYNLNGNTLFYYTLGQYYCYDFSIITSADPPYGYWNAYLGWSMYAHDEFTNYQTSDSIADEGDWRFNGPFGIGCKSGYNTLIVLADGRYGGNVVETSEYGC